MKIRPRLAVFSILILLLLLTLFPLFGYFLEKNGRFEDAYHFLPWRHDLLEKEGLLAISEDDYLRAIDFLEMARQKTVLTSNGQMALAQAFWYSEQADFALQEWETLFEKRVYSSEMLLNMAQIYHQHGNYDRELLICQTGVDKFPGLAEFTWRLGVLKMADSPLDSLPYFEQAQALNPLPAYHLTEFLSALYRASLSDDDAYQLTVSAQMLGSVNEWILAQQALERAVTETPTYGPAWALLGEARYQTGVGDAYAALERALIYAPDRILTRAYFGLYWQRRNDFQKAIVQFEQAARLDPQNPLWSMTLGELSYRQGDLIQSYAYYLLAVQSAPQDAAAWRALALYCVQTESYLNETGLLAALKANTLAPDDWLNPDALGQTLMALGQNESARRMFVRAMELAPDEPAPRFHQGLLFLRMGENGLARQHLRDALALQPQGELADDIQHVLKQYFP